MTPLADAWVSWLAENLLRGAPFDDLVAALAAQGLPEDDARHHVSAVRASPVLAGARRLVERSAGVEQAARLLRTVAAPVSEVATLDRDTLHRAHWSVSRPVIWRGAARDWPATAWTPRSLAERFGDVEVDALDGRTTRWDWWNDRGAITRRLTVRALMARVEADAGDDLYCDGRTHVLAQPGLEALRGELGTLPGLVGDGFPSLWVGPTGTVTPLHHDQSSGWFVQLHGSKRMWMASPLESALFTTAVGLYNRVDAREPQQGELAEVGFSAFEVHAGDAVFIPVGWWHQVVATTPSISVSLGGFEWPNAHLWYHPGRT